MPVYEYEHVFDECEIAGTTFAVVQGIGEAPLEFCPGCGLEVRRVVSQVSVQVRRSTDPEKAAARGFTTWKRSEQGVWEKLAGSGVDVILDPDKAP